MPDITPNHPAVEAATPDIHSISLREYTPEDCHETIADALNAALPHLTADDLRNTSAGRELMAEGWDALIESMSASGEFHDVDLRTMQRLNPYRKADA